MNNEHALYDAKNAVLNYHNVVDEATDQRGDQFYINEEKVVRIHDMFDENAIYDREGHHP